MSAVYPSALSALLAGEMALTDPGALGLMLVTEAFVYDGTHETLGDVLAGLADPSTALVVDTQEVTVTDTYAGALWVEPVIFPGLVGPTITGAVVVWAAPGDRPVTDPTVLRLVAYADRVDRLPMAIVPDGSDLTLDFYPLLRI